MAKKNSNPEVDTKDLVIQKIKLNTELAKKNPSPSNALSTVTTQSQGVRDTKKMFDYIEEHTGERTYLTTAQDRINDNLIKAEYNDAKQKSAEQGFLGELAGFAAQTVAGEIVLGTLEGAGYLLDFQHWGSQLMGGEADWGNWFSDAMADGKEWIREAAPIYQDPDNESRGTFENMLYGDGWWASNGVSVASSLSILIPVAGWARGVGMAGKGLRYVGQAARAGKYGGKAAKATKTVDKVLEVMPKKAMMSESAQLGMQGLHKATVSRLIESQMEATAVFKEKYEFYKDLTGANGAPLMTDAEAKEAAGEAAALTYKLNWAALATDLPQYLLLGYKGKKLKNALHAKKPGWMQNSTLLNKTKNIRSGAFNFVSEGAEEAYQYIVSEEGKRLGDIHAGIREEDDSTFSERMSKYREESEMWTSAFFGGLGGMVFSAAGPKATQLMNKAFRKGEAALTEADLRKAEERDRYTILAGNMGAMKAAAETGDAEAEHAAKSNLAYELAKNAVQAGNWKQARAAIAQMKNATAEEKAKYGLDDNFDDFVQDLDDHLEDMDAAADIFNRASSKYTYGLADVIARRQFQQYMYKKNKPKLEQKQLEEFEASISNYNELSKDGRSALQRAVDLRGQEIAVKEYEAMAQKETDPRTKDLMMQEVAKGKEAIKATRAELKEYQDNADILTEDDKMALETVESGGADDAVKLETKKRILEMQNAQNQKEINYWSSREGRRDYKQRRKAAYEKHKAEEKKKKETEAAAKAADKAADPSASSSSKREDFNVREAAKEIVAGNKSIEDYANTPEEVKRLKKAIADLEGNDLQTDGKTEAEEADEDSIEYDDVEGAIEFEEDTEGNVEIEIPEDAEVDEDLDVDTAEDLNQELTSADAHEEIEIPENIQDSSAARLGDDLADPLLSELPAQLAWQSSNNELAEDITPEMRALSAFLESPATLIQEYEVEISISGEYIKGDKITKERKALVNKMLKQLQNGEMPADAEVGFMPMKAVIVKDGKPVQHGGVDLVMHLHDPDFFFKRDGTPKNKSSHVQKIQAIQHKRALVRKLMQTDGKLVAKLAGKSNGKLNVEVNDDGSFAKNPVAQVLKKNMNRVKLYFGDTDGKYIQHNGVIRMANLSTAEAGAMYAEVETANGSKFPLRLHVDNLSAGEGSIIHSIYRTMLKNPAAAEAEISDAIKNYIKESKEPRVAGLADYLDLDTITYQELLSHLVYEGSRTKGNKKGRLGVLPANEAKKMPAVVAFGDKKMSLERFEHAEGQAEFINWLMATKRRQVDRARTADEAYKSYLNDAMVISTNAKATPEGNLFVQPVVTFEPRGMRVEGASKVKEETEDMFADANDDAPGVSGTMTEKTERKGEKQIERTLGKLNAAKTDIDRLNAINTFNRKVDAGAEPTLEEKAQVAEALAKVEANGLYMGAISPGTKWDGMNGHVVESRGVNTLPEGVEIITAVIKPQIIQDGKMVQAPEVRLAVGGMKSPEREALVAKEDKAIESGDTKAIIDAKRALRAFDQKAIDDHLNGKVTPMDLAKDAMKLFTGKVNKISRINSVKEVNQGTAIEIAATNPHGEPFIINYDRNSGFDVYTVPTKAGGFASARLSEERLTEVINKYVPKDLKDAIEQWGTMQQEDGWAAADSVFSEYVKDTLKPLMDKYSKEDKGTDKAISTATESIKNTIDMFQKGLKKTDGAEIKVNMPNEDDFDTNPC